MKEALDLAIGPYGALSLTLAAVVYLAVQWQKCRAALAREMAARLEDSKCTTDTLLALNDKIHKTIAQLGTIARQLKAERSATSIPPERYDAPVRLSRPGPPKSND